jgi:hypothetical protein
MLSAVGDDVYDQVRSTRTEYLAAMITIPCYLFVAQQLHNIASNVLNSVAVVRRRTIPTERPPLVSEVSIIDV